MMYRSTLLILIALLLSLSAGAPTDVFAKSVGATRVCGTSPSDWCPSSPGDPCGQHKNTAACKADPKCYGMPYKGESFVACMFDARGFASNCPTVGCTSRRPAR